MYAPSHRVPCSRATGASCRGAAGRESWSGNLAQTGSSGSWRLCNSLLELGRATALGEQERTRMVGVYLPLDRHNLPGGVTRPSMRARSPWLGSYRSVGKDVARAGLDSARVG